MNFCWYCGKVFNKSYLKTHVGIHVSKGETTLEECKQNNGNHPISSMVKIVNPWCGNDYEDWRFNYRVLDTKRMKKEAHGAD